MARIWDRSGEASRTDWFALNEPPDPDDGEYQEGHAVQDRLFQLGAYDAEAAATESTEVSERAV